MSDSKTSSGGVGFAGLLTIAFIVLKLCKVIDWSWWWVISPILFSIGLVLLFLGGIGIYYLWEHGRDKKRVKSIIKTIDDSKRTQSKWQDRLDEMQKQQAKAKTN